MGALGAMARMVRAWFYPPRGAVTLWLLRRHCRGRGIEVGPGAGPYLRTPGLVLMDKYPRTGPGALPLDIVGDAAAIPRPDASFDFLVSSHCLEHCPDTLRVLREWLRVVRPGGTLALILPHAGRTFDRGRPLATVEHHLEDERRGVDEGDAAHFADFERWSIPQHDHAWKPEACRPDGTWDREWIVRNGHMHWHAWTQHEMAALVSHLGCRVLAVLEELPERPDSFLVIAATPA